MSKTFLRRLDSTKRLKEIDLGLNVLLDGNLSRFFRQATLISVFDTTKFQVSSQGPVPFYNSGIIWTLEQALRVSTYKKPRFGPILPIDKNEMRGIYKLENDQLVYCWSQPGHPRPYRFEVAQDSGKTLVRLKRYETGEAEIENQLLAMGVKLSKEEEKELEWIRTITISTSCDVAEAINLASKLKTLRKIKIAAGNPFHNKQVNFSVAPGQPFPVPRPTLSADSIKQLAECAELKVLNLTGIAINDGTKQLAKCIGLESLILDRTDVDDESLSQLKNLEHLSFLSLNSTRITDQALDHIAASMPALSNLSARGIKGFTDKGLAKLGKLKSLHWLSVSPNTFSSNAVAKTGRLTVFQSKVLQRVNNQTGLSWAR